MAFPPNSLSAFLVHAKTKSAESAKRLRKITIVIGNESADLDSLTASLLYSYITSTHPPDKAFSPTYVPFLNLPRRGIRLRPEFSSVCRHAGIQTSNLLTLDDLEPHHLIASDSVRWLLVDHNKLTGRLVQVGSERVIGVIDHHDEEHFVPPTTEPEPRTIEKAGSCTSLVVRHCKASWDAISSSSLGTGAAHSQGENAINDSAFTQSWDAKVAKMALASILIDTANLTAPGKVEAVDGEAVKYLEARIMLSPQDAKAWDRETFFKEIQEAKSDIGELTLVEILEKDYKQWTEGGLNLGISSVVKELMFLVKKAGNGSKYFSDALDHLMDQQDLDLFAIMTSSTTESGDFQRELLLQAKPDAHKFIKPILDKANEELKLEGLRLEGFTRQLDLEPSVVWRNAWWQRDVSKSRKQVAQLLRAAMNSD